MICFCARCSETILSVAFLSALAHSLVSRSLNGDLYRNVHLMLLQSETELIRAFTRPNIFYRLLSAFLSLLIDNLQTYRIMLENAAYANHDVSLFPIYFSRSCSSPSIGIVPSTPNSFPASSRSPISAIGKPPSSTNTEPTALSTLLSATKSSSPSTSAMYRSPRFPSIPALPAIVSFAASELVWRDAASRYRLRRGEQLRAGAVSAPADADGVQSAADCGV